MKIRTKLIGTIAVGAALLVPVAQAQRPDDRAGLHGPGASRSAGRHRSESPRQPRRSRPRAVAAETTRLPVRPDDRAAAAGRAHSDTGRCRPPTHPDNRAEARGPGSIDSVVVVSSSIGFDWRDALIGSLGGIGFVLLLMGGLPADEPAEQDAPGLIQLRTTTAAAGPSPAAAVFVRAAATSGWQRGQYHVPRPPTRVFVIVVRQRGHGSPSRP